MAATVATPSRVFRHYEKVERFEKPECEGILNGTVYIFEKIDGANAGVWMDDDGNLCAASRNHQIMCGEDTYNEFRGLPEYVRKETPLRAILSQFPEWYLHGEWLVKHTLNYPKEVTNQFYVFDVYDYDAGRYLRFAEYQSWLAQCDVLYLKPLAIRENPTAEDAAALLGKTCFGVPKGEGLVLKNYDFQNQWGNCVYAKMVCDDFKEVNHLVFKATRRDDMEVRIISEYVRPARVQKVVNKLSDFGLPIDKKLTPRVLGEVFHDLITEDMWDVLKRFKQPTVNFGVLRKACDAATRNHFFGIIGEGE